MSVLAFNGGIFSIEAFEADSGILIPGYAFDGDIFDETVFEVDVNIDFGGALVAFHITETSDHAAFRTFAAFNVFDECCDCGYGYVHVQSHMTSSVSYHKQKEPA